MTDAASAVLVAGLEGTTLTTDELRFLRQESPAGLTLFARNITQNFTELALLVQSVQSTRAANLPPAVMAIDQEGGRVNRFKPPFPNAGPALRILEGRSDAEACDYIRSYGLMVGGALRACGININFAPVLDILTEPTNDGIGDRVYGETAEAATPRALAYLEGLQASGVQGCLKHFPGQGDAKVDTHKGTAMIPHSRDALLARELVPFVKLIPSASMVMISHCIYPAYDEVPASCSSAVIEGLLRQELKFKGVVVGDDMNMSAIKQDDQGWRASIVASVAAGVDMLLVCRHLPKMHAALEALRAEASRSPAFAARLTEAATRVTNLRKRLF